MITSVIYQNLSEPITGKICLNQFAWLKLIRVDTNWMDNFWFGTVVDYRLSASIET